MCSVLHCSFCVCAIIVKWDKGISSAAKLDEGFDEFDE
jgi:hypothetical protein